MLKTIKKLFAVCVRDLEMPVLCFPILVTCIVAIGFIFKCQCSIVTWWLGIVLTIGLIWLRGNDKRLCLAATISFLLLIGLLWIMANVTITMPGVDDLTYHFPGIRLIAAGWNPVWQSTPEQIKDAFNIDPTAYRSIHMISMPKAVWYFCATFYKFSEAHFNLYFPLTLILTISLLYTTWGMFHEQGRMSAIIVCVSMYSLLHFFEMPCVDMVIQISAMGLLLTMSKCIRTGIWDVSRLSAYSFWMCVSKQTSLLHCAVFWVVFLLALILLKRKICFRKMLVTMLLVFSMFCIVCISPYGTSLANYGSPFYPRYSADEKKWPTQNQTEDFLIRNDDAATMGHLGAYVNAFVSHSLAKAYYVHVAGRKDFWPKSQTWGKGNNLGTPTNVFFKIIFCCVLLILFLFCGVAGKFLAIALFFGTLIIPTEMIGYIRYTPWIHLGAPVCVGMLICPYERYLLTHKKMLFGVVIMMAIAFHLKSSLLIACEIDGAYALIRSMKKHAPNVLICPPQPRPDDSSYYGPKKWHPYGRKEYLANIKLLQLSIPSLRDSKAVVDIRELGGDMECCRPFFDYSFYVLPDCNIHKYSEFRLIQQIPERKRRLLLYPKFILRVFFVTLPKCILEAIYE